MFEASIDETPATPSAQRVRVDSTPMAASPLRYIANAVSGSADSRAHPNAQRDVWELAIWDPLPICVRLFCLFSPGHVLAYWLLLPTQVSDPRPSVTIVTTILVTTLLSVQMSFLSSSFTRQAKDNAVVHKEVLREYDNKYVHPRTQPLMRDVGTQHSQAEAQTNNVDTFTPAFIIQRGFKTSPNPNYVNHVDPEGITPRRQPFATPNASTSTYHTPSHLRDASPIIRPSTTSIRQPQFRPTSTSTSTGDGGSLGIYSHANSPLRKPASTAIDRRLQSNGDFFYKERGTPLKKASSPLKRSSVPGGGSPAPRLSQFSARRDTGRF